MAGRDLRFIIVVDDKGSATIKGFTTKTQSALGKLGGTTEKTGGSFKRLAASAKGSFATFATGLIPTMGLIGVMNKVRQVISSTIVVGRAFEKEFANVTTLMDETSEFTEEFKQALIGLSPTLGKTTDLAKGMYQALSAGVKPAGAIAFLEVVAKSAAAGLSEMDTTVKAIAGTMNAYGMSTATVTEAIANATDISDVLFKTVKGGITTMSELSAGLSGITSVSAAMKVPLEQVGAAIATITKKGLGTRRAILGLSRTLMGFLKPTATTREAIRDLGIEYDAAALAVGGIPYIIKMLSDQFENALPIIEKMTKAGADEAEIMQVVAKVTGKNVAALAALFPNVSSMRTALMLASDAGVEFNAMLAEQKERAGATEEAFKRQMATADFWITTLGNVFEKMKIGFWEGITKPFKDTIRTQEDFKEKFEAFTKSAIEKAHKFGEGLGKIVNFIKEHKKHIVLLTKAYVAWWVWKKKILALSVFQLLAERVTVFRSALQQGARVAGSFKVAVGGVSSKLLLMAKGAAAVGVAIGAWKVGRWIGGLKLFGKSIDEHIQRGMTNAAKRVPILGAKIIALDYAYTRAMKSGEESSDRQKKAFADLASFMEKEMGQATTNVEDIVGTLGERLLDLSSTGHALADSWVRNWMINEAAVLGADIQMKSFEKDMAEFAQSAPIMFNALLVKIRSLKPAFNEAGEAIEAAGAGIKVFTEGGKKFAKAAGFEVAAAAIRDTETAINGLEWAVEMGGVTWEQAVKVMGGSIVGLGDKMIPLMKMQGEKLPAAFMKMYHAAKASVAALESQKKALEETRKIAEDAASGILEAAKQIKDMGKTYSKWNAEMLSEFASSIREVSAQAGTVISEADEMIAGVYTDGKAKDALQAALEADAERFDRMKEKIGDEIEVIGQLYADKKQMINEHYDEEVRVFTELTEMKKREVGIVAEVEKMKLKLQKATTEQAINALEAGFGAKMDKVRSQGLAEIEVNRQNALTALGVYKTEFLDPRMNALWGTLEELHKAEQVSRAKIEGEWGGMGVNWKEMNEQIQADWIRNIAGIIKGGGNLLDGLGSTFNQMTDMWIDKVAKMLTEGKGLWESLKTGFQGLSKGISSTFSGVGGAVSKLGGIIGGGVGKASDFVGGLIGKFGKLAGPIGAAISIGMKLPIIGGIIKGITSKVSGLLSKIPLIGGLFKKSETEAEKAARKMDEMVKGLIGSVSKFGDVTEETAKNIAEAITSGMEGFAAVSKYYSDVLKDVGITQESINDQWKRAGDIIHHVSEGYLSMEEGVNALTDSFTQLLKGAQDFGTEGSKAMSDFIQMVRESGMEIQAVTDYINDQLGVTKSSSMSAAQGLEAMASNTLPGLSRLVERQKELNEKIAGVKEGTPEWIRLNEQLTKVTDRLGMLAEKVGAGRGALASLERKSMAVFNAMIANGATYSEAMESIGGTLDIIAQRHTDLGTTASAGIQELLKIREVTQEHKGLFNAIDGNLAVMNALANTGSLTQEVLQDSANSAKNYYNQLVNAGLSGNQALAQMGPTLERLRFLSEEHNLALDKGTLALIEQAEQAGVLKEQEMSMQETMMAGFGMLLDALGVDLPEAMQKSVDKLYDMEEAMAGSGVVSALGKVKVAASDTFGLMDEKSTSVLEQFGLIEGKLGSVGDASDIMKARMEAAFAKVGDGVDSAIGGIGDLQSTIQKGKWAIPLSWSVPGGPKPGNEPPEFQAGGSFRVTGKEQAFIAHRGEEVRVKPAGAVEKTDKLLERLISVVEENGGGSMQVYIEPVSIPRENETILNFVVRKIEKGDVRIPISAVRGTA